MASTVINVGVPKPKLNYIHFSECLGCKCPFVSKCYNTRNKNQLLILSRILAWGTQCGILRVTFISKSPQLGFKLLYISSQLQLQMLHQTKGLGIQKRNLKPFGYLHQCHTHESAQFGATFLPKSLVKMVVWEGREKMQTGFSLTAAHIYSNTMPVLFHHSREGTHSKGLGNLSEFPSPLLTPHTKL